MEYYREDGVDFSYRGIHKKPIVSQKPLTISYMNVKEESFGLGLDLSTDWARDIIRVRGEELIKNPVGLTIDFLEGKTLTQLAKKYVKDDYEISPRTGRRIIFYALELLVSKGVFEMGFLDGIDPDTLSVKRPLYEKPLYSKPKGYKRVKRVEKIKRVRRKRGVERELVGV